MLKKAIILFLIFALIFSGVYFTWSSGQKIQTLLSPIFQRDFTDKISERISTDFALDFSKSKELTSLSAVPRYMVYNALNNKVYYSKGADQKLSPASFTKLLSAQVALDLIPINEQIIVSSESINKIPTILGLKSGEKFVVKDILRGAIATSANDAAQVLADESARYQKMTNQEFLYYMNKKATLLGMNHSHFSNPDGLDEQNQYSTLADLTKLVNNIQKKYPEILEAAIADNIDIATSSAHGYYYLPNWNGLLGVYPGVDGLKIAYTEEAGYSTIVTYTKGDQKFVALVSGTGSYLERDRAAADLLDAALMAEGELPHKITTYNLNLRYKTWGDLARKIRAELKQLEK